MVRRDNSNVTNAKIEVRVAPRPPRTKTALINVRVFDGYDIQPASTVYVDDDRISDDPANVKTIVDGQGAVLLPGLIDSHAHPTTIAALETLSSYGITTVMSMSCANYQVCASLRNQVGLTSFFTAGNPAIGPNSSHAINQHLPDYQLIHSTAEVPSWVKHVFGNGSDYLKITAEEHGPSQDTQNALVSYTHATGRKTMTHASEYQYYVGAIQSKSNGPQHMPFDNVLNDTILNLMKSQGQFATPTTILYKLMLPNTEALKIIQPDAVNFNASDAYATVATNVRKIRAHGIPVLAGTDSVAPGLYPVSIPFGITLHQEMFNLVQIGFTPAEAIRAATLVPAMTYDLHDRGRIVKGMRADLMLLKPGAAPLMNINDTLKIQRVWNGGVEYGPVAVSE